MLLSQKQILQKKRAYLEALREEAEKDFRSETGVESWWELFDEVHNLGDKIDSLLCEEMSL